MDSIANFRELGNLPVAGGSIAAGRLFRSGHLAEMSDMDAQRFGDLGIRTVVDLRTDSDIASEGQDRVPLGVVRHHLPIDDDAGRGNDLRDIITRGNLEELRTRMGHGRAHQIALRGAIGFVRDPMRVASFARAMAIIVEPDNWPLLWHCSAGKDRAGWIGTCVLLAADAPTEVIVDHYLESNRMSGAKSRFPDGEAKELVLPFLEVHEDYVRGQLTAVKDRWGGADGLFGDGFGLAPLTLQRFRSVLIEPS